MVAAAHFKKRQSAASKNTHGAFDCLRLLAAAAVLFSHSYALVRADADEPLAMFIGQDASGLAVFTFFAISGYLVTRSWFSDPSPIRFVTRRALRIFPALALVIFVSFALVGPLTTRLSLADYFSSGQAWTYLDKVLIYPTQYGLPGVFEHNPFPDVVNGSLWTLRLEFGFYVIVAALGYLGLLRWRWVNIAVATGCWAGSAVLTQTDFLHGITWHHQVIFLFLNAVPFFIGAALAQSNIDSKLIFGGTIALLLMTALSLRAPVFEILLIVSLPLTVIQIARRCTCDLHRFGDYSYGIYLFAFPVQQAVIHFRPGIHSLQLSIVAGAATVACAFASWHLVEKRALALKPRRRKAADVPLVAAEARTSSPAAVTTT
jgi:peptidoglycan/LPS O-acetylase OafA/YrhL